MQTVTEMLIERGFSAITTDVNGNQPVAFLDRNCPGNIFDLLFDPDQDVHFVEISRSKNSGDAMHKDRCFKKAIQDYTRAINVMQEHLPQLPRSKKSSLDIEGMFIKKADCLLDLNLTNEAVEDLKQCVTMNEQYFQANLRVGMLLRDTNHPQEALTYLFNAYRCVKDGDEDSKSAKEKVFTELTPVLLSLQNRSNLQVISKSEAPIWAKVCYKWVTIDDWEASKVAYEQFQRNERKKDHTLSSLNLKPFGCMDKLQKHPWCLSLIHYLLECGCDEKTLSFEREYTYLQAVVRITLVGGSERLLTSLLSRPELTDHLHVDTKGNTLLHTAARQTNVKPKIRYKVLNELVKCGVDASLHNMDGKVPIEYLQTSEAENINILLQAMHSEGVHVLMTKAARLGQYTFLLVLLKCGADPMSLSGEDGDIPMHAVVRLALKDGNTTVLEYLLKQYGIEPKPSLDPESLDLNGDCLFHLLAKSSSKHVVKVGKCLCQFKVSGNYYNREGKLPVDCIVHQRDGLLQHLKKAKSFKARHKQLCNTTTPDAVFVVEHDSNLDNGEKDSSKSVVEHAIKEVSEKEKMKFRIRKMIKQLALTETLPEETMEIHVHDLNKPIQIEDKHMSSSTHIDIDETVNMEEIGNINEHNDEDLTDEDNETATHDNVNLTDTDTQLMDKMDWEVECTSDVWKILRESHYPPDLKRRMLMAIQLLASGDWQPHLYKKVRHLPATLNLFEAKFSKGGRIVWELAIAFSPRLSNTEGDIQGKVFSEIIRIWDVVVDHDNLKRTIRKIEKSHKRGENCIVKKTLMSASIATTQVNAGMRYPRLFMEASFGNNDESQNQTSMKLLSPASSNENEYHILKFYSFSSALMRTVLQNIETKVDFPFRVTDTEHALINLKCNAPILLIGRSGTGKTTCCLYRLWSQFRAYWATSPINPILPRLNSESICDTNAAEQKDQDIYDHLHQLFITKNAVLCGEVQRNFRELRKGENLIEGHMQQEDENLPSRLQDVKDYAFPVFVTSRKLLLMLDVSVGPPYFFDRNEDGSLKEEIRGWNDKNASIALVSVGECLEDEDYIVEVLNDEIETTSTSRPHLSKNGATIVDHTKEITYRVFVDKFWKHFKQTPSSYHPSLVWTEIMSFIEGSYEALSEPKGYLDRKQYNDIGRKRAPNFSGDRDVIYSLFLEYKKFKKANALFGETDLVHSVLRRLIGLKNRPWAIHQIFVDETQDFTQAELCLLIRLCQNPNDMFFTGDTAQSIMRGISFRFQDLRSLFHFKQEANRSTESPIVAQPEEVHKLVYNYRTHAGILRLASSVLEIMTEMFPESFDSLPPDQGLFEGPMPTVFESGSVSDLVLLLKGNQRNTSPIEFGAHQVILVVNDDAREALPSVLKLGLVLTIFEAKGLEFDDVLLYNFFTNSQARKEWRVVTEYLNRLINQTDNVDQFDYEVLKSSNRSRPLKFDANQHKVLNSELKHLYTALTRARVNVWIFDEDCENRAPMFEFFKARKLVKNLEGQEINESSSHGSVFAVQSSPGDWRRRGQEMMKHKMYTEASKCFRFSGDSKLEKMTQAHAKARLASELKDNPSLMHLEFLCAAELYLECNKRTHAARCLQNANELKLAAKLFEQTGEFGHAANLYRRLNISHDSSRLYEKDGNFNKAISVLCANGAFESALDTLRRYEMKLRVRQISIHDNSQQNFEFNEFIIQQRAAEFYHQRKNTESMVKAVSAFPELNDRVKFLEDRGYISLAARLLKDDNQCAAAVDMLVSHMKLDEAVTLAKEKLTNKDIGKYILIKCRINQVNSSNDSISLSNQITMIDEAIEMFNSCDDNEGLGAACLLKFQNTKETCDIKRAIDAFEAVANEAGKIECADAIVSRKLFSIFDINFVVSAIDEVFRVCHTLSNPKRHVDKFVQYGTFYGFSPCSEQTVRIKPCEKPLCLKYLGNLSDPCEKRKEEVGEALVRGLMQERLTEWVVTFRRVNEETRKEVLCKTIRAFEQCENAPDQEKIFDRRRKDAFEFLIQYDILNIELEHRLFEETSSFERLRFPRIIKQFNDEPHKYQGSLSICRDLIIEGCHLSYTASDITSLLDGIVNNTKVHQKLEVFLNLQCLTHGYNKYGSVGFPGGKQELMGIAFSCFMFRKTENVLTNSVLNSFQMIMTGNFSEAVEHFNNYINMVKLETLSDPETIIVWFEFFCTIASLMIAKLKDLGNINGDTPVFILRSYLHLIKFVEAVLPAELDIMRCLNDCQLNVFGDPDCLDKMQTVLANIILVLVGSKSQVRLMDILVKKCTDQPEMAGIVERLVMLGLTLACNVDITVPVKTKSSIMNMLKSASLPTSALSQIRKTVEELKNVSETSEVSTILMTVLESRNLGEELVKFTWENSDWETPFTVERKSGHNLNALK